MVMKLVVAAALALLLGAPASAQDATTAWPTRPVTMIVPFPAGGPVDLVARLLSQRLTESLGQPVVVENMGGAGGMTGAARVAKSPPDGSMFVFGTQGSHTFSQMLYKKPLYDAVKDFAPVAVVVENSKLLLTRKDLPVNNLQEFITYAKANQAKLQFGSAGTGSATHVACVLLNNTIGVDITHVPYRGTAPAMQDVVAGRIDYICEIVSTAQPFVQAGMVKPIALLATERSRVYPDLPTADEQGLKGFAADGWNAFFFPKDTPEPIVRKLAKATSDILDVPEVHDRLESFGLNVPPRERRTPEYLEKLVRSDLEKWAPPVKASGAMASE
jgi:tripartite-type tricarboxylate transporter receptor subunit TctC